MNPFFTVQFVTILRIFALYGTAFCSSKHPADHRCFHTRWQAPSNIALIKYWGKKAPQIPLNASLSFTLSNAITQTKVRFLPLKTPTKAVTFSIRFEGEENQNFALNSRFFLPKYFPINLF
jgi:hypothetical protein